MAFDYTALVMVAFMSGNHVSADHARVYAGIEGLDRRGKAFGRPIALVFVVAKGTATPDAYWRRRFAEQRKTLASPHVYLAMVTDSAVMRGVLIAMAWVVPEPPHMSSTTHATIEEAAGWIERKQGSSQFIIFNLLADARRPTHDSSAHS